jgi:hypothetical protein
MKPGSHTSFVALKDVIWKQSCTFWYVTENASTCTLSLTSIILVVLEEVGVVVSWPYHQSSTCLVLLHSTWEHHSMSKRCSFVRYQTQDSCRSCWLDCIEMLRLLWMPSVPSWKRLVLCIDCQVESVSALDFRLLERLLIVWVKPHSESVYALHSRLLWKLLALYADYQPECVPTLESWPLGKLPFSSKLMYFCPPELFVLVAFCSISNVSRIG